MPITLSPSPCRAVTADGGGHPAGIMTTISMTQDHQLHTSARVQDYDPVAAAFRIFSKGNTNNLTPEAVAAVVAQLPGVGKVRHQCL